MDRLRHFFAVNLFTYYIGSLCSLTTCTYLIVFSSSGAVNIGAIIGGVTVVAVILILTVATTVVIITALILRGRPKKETQQK